MTSETTIPAHSPAPPEPSAEQLARRARRKRSYRLRVIVPMALVTLLWLGLALLLFWLAVAGQWFSVDTDQAYYRTLISGLADVIMILTLLPLLLLCVLPSALALGLVVYRRSKKKEAPAEPEKLPLFWRIENIVIAVQQRLETILPKVARPVISAHAAVAFVRKFLKELRGIVTREIDRYVR